MTKHKASCEHAETFSWNGCAWYVILVPTFESHGVRRSACLRLNAESLPCNLWQQAVNLWQQRRRSAESQPTDAHLTTLEVLLTA
eukprot:473934-Pelagomonas_calceolata.AAC.1